MHAVVGQAALISVCKETGCLQTWVVKKWLNQSNMAASFQTLVPVWLTYAVVSVPLVAQRTIAGVGASGVVARLLQTTGVSTCCTFIDVCSQHRRQAVSKGRLGSLPVQCVKSKKKTTGGIDLFGLRKPCDHWCVNAFPQSQVCDPWRRHNAGRSTRAHVCAESGQLNKGGSYSAAGGEVWKYRSYLLLQGSFCPVCGVCVCVCWNEGGFKCLLNYIC